MFKTRNTLLFTLAIAISSSGFASTELIAVNLECPRAYEDGSTTGVGALSNDGLIISGLGSEFINGREFPHPLFAETTPDGVPQRLRLGAYYRSDTDYSSESGVVTCHYTSSAGYSPFEVHYRITNGRGGYIKYKTVKSINVGWQVGLKK